MGYRDSDARLQKALEDALHVPVRRLVYKGEATPALAIYQCTSSVPVMWADDDVYAERHSYRIDIYARTGHVALVRAAHDALYAAGFDGISGNGEDYDDSAQMYHAELECSYTEQEEG